MEGHTLLGPLHAQERVNPMSPGLTESFRPWLNDELELGEFVTECLWWENNIYRQNGNVLLWHRGSEGI
jgi:hypothetical protein